MHRVAWKAGVLGAFNAVSVILAVRLTLLLAVAGAFVLAYLAVQQADAYRAVVVLIYAVVVVVPLIWSSVQR